MDEDRNPRDAFVTQMMAWAEVRGLLIPEAPSLHAAANYVLTARAIAFDVGPSVEGRACAELLARYMLIVAAGDDGIFDRVLPGERALDRRARLEASARFLCDVIRGERAAPPDVPGAPLLAGIADGWREIDAEHERRAAPSILEGFRRALSDLYEASVREHQDTIYDDPKVAAALRGVAPEVLYPMAPRVVWAWIDELVASESTEELRVVSYLVSSGNTIGAGLIFHAAALSAPAEGVTSEMASLLGAVAELTNYRLRIDNDLSELSSLGGDRDAKETSISVLLPRGARDEGAMSRALAVVRGVGARLDAELARAIEELDGAWPSMARLVRRAIYMGRRTYALGHYKTISHAALRAMEPV